MKNILFIIVAILTISCKAQSPIVALDTPSHTTTNGTYFKDLNNELDKFVGTWKFIDSSSELTIQIEKKEQVPIRNKFRDYLVGEYKFIKNSEEIVNTLSNLNQNTNNENMGGSAIYPPNRAPKCSICTPDERRLKMYFKDPEREYLNSNVMLRYIIGSTPPKIEVKLYQRHGAILPQEDSPVEPRVPYGTYLMIKQ